MREQRNGARRETGRRRSWRWRAWRWWGTWRWRRGGGGGGGGHRVGGGGGGGLHIHAAKALVTPVRTKSAMTSQVAKTHGHFGNRSAHSHAASQFAHSHIGHGPKTSNTLKASNKLKATTNLKATNNLKAKNSALTNARVRPLAQGADPRHFEERRRNFAENAAFRPFVGHDWGATAGIPTVIWAGSARCSGLMPTAISFIMRCGPTTTNMSIRSGPTATATSTRPFSLPIAMRST